MMFVNCSACGKPFLNEVNLERLRIYCATAGVGSGLAGAFLGAAILPAFGFQAAGVAKGSIGAYVQSYLGSVKAGSLFAAVQSLGATGAGVLLTAPVGSLAMGVAVYYIAQKIVEHIQWCQCKVTKLEIVNA